MIGRTVGILDRLGSARRITTALNSLLGEDELRSLAETHRLVVPGFRVGRGPAPLLARSAATACATNPRLRKALEARIDRLAGSARRAGVLPSGEALARLETLDALSARSALAAALTDTRDDVAATAISVLDEIESGARRLPRPPARRPARAEGAPAVRARSDEPRARERTAPRVAPADSLEALRREATRQEAVRTRLREQLDAERAAHRETRTALERTRGRGGRSEEGRPLGEARARLRAREDLATLIEGARALEHLLDDRPEDPVVPVRPTRPRRRSATPPEAKARVPSSAFWPDRLDAFLRRLTADPYVERVFPIGVSAGRTSRVLGDIGCGWFILQYADRRRAAQLLVETTADTAPARAWVRRHLATEHVDSR